jgi:predicted MPP superfamily phosphohydrolase
MKLNRRATLVGLGGAALALGASRSLAEPRRVHVSHHRVHWPLGRAVRVAQLTDIHVGLSTPSRTLEEAAALTRAARPDLVVLTGDYVNHSLDHLEGLDRFVRSLPGPIVATLGNHDYWSGAEPIVATLRAAGACVLRNESEVLRLRGVHLPVVGVDDSTTQHHDVPRALAAVSAPALVLTHNPRIAGGIAAGGRARLIMCGHTHAGQVAVPLLTPMAFRASGMRHFAGRYTEGAATIYVSAGLGHSTLRLGRTARPEVAIFDLVDA